MEGKYRIAKNIRAIMDSRGWRPGDFKTALRDANLDISTTTSSNYISLNEGAVRIPSLDIILDIAKALKVKTNVLLGADFEEHDLALAGKTACGSLLIDNDMGLGKNLDSHTLTQEIEGFKKGDRLLVDGDDKIVSLSGFDYFLVSLNNRSEVIKLSDTGTGYLFSSVSGNRDLSYESVKIQGKIVARITTDL